MSTQKKIKINPDLFNLSKSGKNKNNSTKNSNSSSSDSNVSNPGNLKNAISYKKALLNRIKNNSRKKISNSFESISNSFQLSNENNLENTIDYLNKSSILSSKSKNITPVNTNSIHPIPHVHSNTPPYGCLKNGKKKTFKQWHSEKNNIPPPKLTLIDGLPSHHNDSSSERKKLFEINKNKFKTKYKNTKKSLHYASFGKEKKKGRKTIKVLIKPSHTYKKIEQEKRTLQNHNIKKIKTYLTNHGLLKSGSTAPDEVLKEMYLNAFLAGDIHNKEKGVLLHNYLADSEKEYNYS